MESTEDLEIRCVENHADTTSVRSRKRPSEDVLNALTLRLLAKEAGLDLE